MTIFPLVLWWAPLNHLNNQSYTFLDVSELETVPYQFPSMKDEELDYLLYVVAHFILICSLSTLTIHVAYSAIFM